MKLILMWLIGGTISLGAFGVLVMLPVYFFRKYRNPLDTKNTIKSLITKALLAGFVLSVFMSSGLIMMYIEECLGR